MKILCALMLLLSQLFGSELDKKDITLRIFNLDGKPTELLQEALKLDGLFDPEDDYQTIKKKTQEKWLRCVKGSGGVERRDLIDSPQEEAMKGPLTSIMRKMGLFDEAPPEYTTYDYAIVLGAFLPAVQDRIDYLKLLWDRGVRFKKIVFLTGERPLRPDEKKIVVEGETEADMIRYLVKNLTLPVEDICIVDVPARDGLRPSTEDTYKAWVSEYNLKEGTILAISSPLFVYLQHLVGKKALPVGFCLDTVARGVTDQDLQGSYYKTSVLLDTLAKLIYSASI